MPSGDFVSDTPLIDGEPYRPPAGSKGKRSASQPTLVRRYRREIVVYWQLFRRYDGDDGTRGHVEPDIGTCGPAPQPITD